MNIFIAKLSPETTGDDLMELFGQMGRVDSAKVIYDRQTNRSKGFGFVEMPNDREAQQAIDELNDTEFKGSQIVVKVSQPKPQGQGKPRQRTNGDY